MPSNGAREGAARGDRLREKYEQLHRGTRNALDKLRAARELPAYGNDDNEITANRHGLRARNIPKFAWWPISFGIAAFLVCLGLALVHAFR